jgi:beta-glucosidase
MLTHYARLWHAGQLAETCVTADVETRIARADASVGAVRELPAEGVEVVGYRWRPLFDMYEWTYRHTVAPRASHLLTMGLHDLVEAPAGLERRRNPVADRFAAYARQGAQ